MTMLSRAEILSSGGVSLSSPITDEALYTVFDAFADLTMIPERAYVRNLRIALTVADVDGCVVECGTWKGGMLGGIGVLLGPERQYFGFDSFEGLPPVTELDGTRAATWQGNTTSPGYFDNCSAEQRFAEEAMRRAHVTDSTIVKGWFEDTLPATDIPPIALLRLDGDWYDSTMTCLEQLAARVVHGGIIVIDDYFAWEGCAKAVHDYLSRTGSNDRIVTYGGVCYIMRGAFTEEGRDYPDPPPVQRERRKPPTTPIEHSLYAPATATAPAAIVPPAPAEYFPNRTPELLAVESNYRQRVSQLSEPARHEAYTVFTRHHSEFVDTTFSTDGDFIVAHQLDHTITYPYPLPLIKYAHISCGYDDWLKRKYSLPGFVEVEPDDVVVDCGGYVGGFSLSAIRVASELHVFEPEPANVACIVRNLGDARSIVVNQSGLYNTSGTQYLNISASSVEHSLLQPDDGEAVDQISIEVIRLDDYCERNGIAALDFVKVEAEGVEFEVIEGLGTMRPAKLAIDVSPERDQQSPAPEIGRLLTDWGYELRQRGHVLFARRRVMV